MTGCGSASTDGAPPTADTTTTIDAVINHDTVQGFAESASPTELQFKPTLKVFAACEPFPAVDAAGNTSGGLKPTGSVTGGCARSVGQVYSRMAHYYDLCAIMYAWYFPKDQWISGHRHDWESIVVWLTECSPTARVVSISYSGHGQYKKESSPPLDGTHPKVRYASNGIMNHEMWPTDDAGGTQPLVSWENLTPAARDALTNTDFGNANVPFKAGGACWSNLQLAH